MRDIKDRPDLVQGVRRGIIDKLHDDLYSIAEVSAKPATFKRFMDKNESVLRKYFDKDQITALDRIYSDMASEVRTEELARRGSIGNSVTAQKGALKQELQELIQNEFGTVGNILRNGGKVGTALGAAAGFSNFGLFGSMVGASAGGTLGAKVTSMITRAENAAMRELAKAAADPAVALQLLSKSSSKRKNVIRQVLEKKMNPIRQILVSGYIGTREDDNKLAEDMASLLPQNRLMAAPTPTPSQAADLANALSQNRGGGLLQQPAVPTMGANQAMSENEPKQGGQRAADVDLTPRNVEPDLVDAVIFAESSGRTNAVGPNTKYGTAKGLMQLIDSTGKEMHQKLGLKGKYDPFDADQNRLIGTAYLDELVGRYDNSVPLGLAAYNWGMGNLEKAFDKLGRTGPTPVQAMMEQAVRDGMKGGMSERQAKRAAAAQVVDTFGIEVLNPYMPDETRNYVRKIMNRYTKTKRNGIVEA
jgi:soluble lytic murein transglycosylase-like protein/outer membrane lipoprotein SlyB